MALPRRTQVWPSLDPGELDSKITIQQPLESQDSTGALIQTWITYVELYAGIDPYGGGEKWADANMAATNLFKMKMRYIAGVTTKMRVKFDGRTFDIENVENVGEKGVVLILKCLERLYDESGRRVQ